MLRQSPLFAVNSISITSSFNKAYVLNSFPSLSSPILSSRIITPSFILGNPISVEPQIIPCDSTPRSFAFLISKSSPKTVPTVAAATNCPAATFLAPQTI